MNNNSWAEIEDLLKDLLQNQQDKLLKSGRRLIPKLTTDDILQPNDFPELENNPHFRYEEGIVTGVQMVQMAIQALKKRLTKDH